MKMLKVLALVCGAFCSSQARADYPDRPIRLLVPFAAGGLADILARLVGQQVAADTGKALIVENRTGAGGRIGYEAGARAEPDGYTFVVTDVTYTMLPSLFQKLSWNPNDLVPVTLLGETPFVVASKGSAPSKDLRALVTEAKAQPAHLNYGSAGLGSVNHVVTELFTRTAGMQMTHVPYRGMGDAMNDIFVGSLDILVTALPTALGATKGGQIRALAVTSQARVAALPDTPTTTEMDVPFVASNWIGLTAPKGTPPEAITWIQTQFAKALSSPEISRRFADQGVQAAAMSSDQFSSFMQGEEKRWGDVIRSAGIKVN